MANGNALEDAINALAIFLRQREEEFVDLLDAAKLPDLSNAYEEIASVRRTYDVLRNPSPTTRVIDLGGKMVSTKAKANKPKTGPGRGASVLPELPFSLRDAVLMAAN